jgi:hypothetical protein
MDITLDDFSWDNYSDIAKNIVRINKEDLGTELSDQPYRYTMFHGLFMKAKYEYDKAVHSLERYTALQSKKTRAEWVVKGKKITDKALEMEVTSSEEYNILKEDVTDKNYKVGLLKGLVASLDQRHSMIIQLSSNIRSETKLYNK